ncbi:hypothetical protein HYW40_00290 [Candidatus Curtissbacteria bacterium]|nr:hypothetical protein [Candidatus Curtissbacteria bacterium]
MDQDSKQKTLDNLTKAQTILVAVSKNAPFDALASGLALYLSCVKLGKNASILAKSPSVGEAQRLYGVDKIGRFEGNKNLIVVVNDAVDNVDKVTYSLEDTKLKIVVHPFPGAKNVTPDQISFEETPSKPNLIFSVGYRTPEELKQDIVHEQNLDPNIWVVNINKEDMGGIFAQVNIFNQEAASVSEVTAQLFQELALPLDEDISYNLYIGIASATENFAPALASPLSFETAAWLLKFGAGRAGFANPGSSHREMPEPDFAPIDQPAIENVERKKTSPETWLKPPRIYKGSKSFDREN